jgi:ribosomal-protein-alanine N-acetyltransferase
MVLETQRLILRRFTLEDAAFVLELVNDPAWLANIGDRKVRTLEDARGYLRKGVLAMYERVGFGMYVVTLKESGESIGSCGLIQREELPDVDIGFAFLPRHRGRGFAFESAAAVMEYGTGVIGLKRIVAIVSAKNQPSIRVLEKIGLRFERTIRFGEEEEIPLYAYPPMDAGVG